MADSPILRLIRRDLLSPIDAADQGLGYRSGPFRCDHLHQPSDRNSHPPVGVLMFTTCGIAKVSVMGFVKAEWPFYISLIAVLASVTYLPQVVMWLPSLIIK